MILLKVNDRIKLRNIKFFNDDKISLKYDSLASTFAFAMEFDPDNKEHAELACVSHIHECKLIYEHEDKSEELLITGFMLSQAFQDDAKSHLANISGYTKTGVLEDCDIPISIYPLESNGLTFREIVQKVIKPFGDPRKGGFKFIVRSGKADSKFTEDQKVDRKIDKSTAPESKNIKEYLTELATQKNLVLSHTPEGNLLVTTANTGGKPLFEIDADRNPGVGYVSMSLVYNGQPMHSEITVIRQADIDGGNSAEYTIKNPLVPIVFRPRVVSLTSGDDVTIEEAARNELGKELKAITLNIVMDRATINKKFITPNNTIIVRNRKLFLYNKTKWFIEGVDFNGDAEKETVTLTCVLTYVYNNQTPVNPFVDPHKNLPRV
jgi:prophage tail gpP-like protein